MKVAKKQGLLGISVDNFGLIYHYSARLDVVAFLQTCQHINKNIPQNTFKYLFSRDYPDYFAFINKSSQENYFSLYKTIYLFSLICRFRYRNGNYLFETRVIDLYEQFKELLDAMTKISSLQVMANWMTGFLGIYKLPGYPKSDVGTNWELLRSVLLCPQRSPLVDQHINKFIAWLRKNEYKLSILDYQELKKVYDQSKNKAVATLLGEFSDDSKEAQYWLAKGNDQALRNLASIYIKLKKTDEALAIAEKNNFPDIEYTIYKEFSQSLDSDHQKRIAAYTGMKTIADQKGGKNTQFMADILYQMDMSDLKIVDSKADLKSHRKKYSNTRHYFDPRRTDFNEEHILFHYIKKKEYENALILLHSIIKQEENNDEYFLTEAHLFAGKIYCLQQKFQFAAEHFTKALQLGDLWGMTHLYQLMQQSPDTLSVSDRIAILQALILENFRGILVTNSFALLNPLRRLQSEKSVYSFPHELLEQACESKDSAESAIALTAKGIIKTYLEAGKTVQAYSNQSDTMEMAEGYFKTALELNRAAVKQYLSAENPYIFPRVRDKFQKIIVKLGEKSLISHNPSMLMPKPSRDLPKPEDSPPSSCCLLM